MEESEEHPKVLIEEWFPFEEVGIECRRERGVVSAMPPTNYLHVWWARRPLVASKAAILGSILKSNFDKNDFNKLMKFEENLKEIYQQMQIIKKKGKRSLIGYKKKRAFSQNINDDEKKLIKTNSIFQNPRIIDTMAGGGSIPFEGMRLSLDVSASELNPVALIILHCCLRFPAEFKMDLMKDIIKFGMIIDQRIKEKLKKYFFWKKNQTNFQYIWSRTITCPDPECGLIIPLSPNWDLVRTSKRIILKLEFSKKDFTKNKVNFKIIENPSKDILIINPGTIKRGIGTCPRCNNTLTRDYIKKEAQVGRMGHQLIAIVYQEKVGKKKIRRFRVPSIEDLKVFEKADNELREMFQKWKDLNLIPDEVINMGLKTRELLNKGIDRWYKLFNSRQLLVNITILKEIIKLKNQLLKNSNYGNEKSKAIITYLQLALDKIIDYNSISTIWSPTTERISHTFARHDFAFKWSYAEIDIIGKGYDWAIENVSKSYKGLVNLVGNSNSIPKIYNLQSQNLLNLNDKEFHAIIIDPPYYDNVMYGELSDFFYVWMKRGLNDLYPKIFNFKLTDKDNEAVANPSRFEGMGESKAKLAKQDYEAKMELIFKELYRILNNKGVLTIMFTHKSTDAWDTLAMSLMEAGFEITASWPVHTESEISLHIAKKNAVKTTIFLVCRKRLVAHNELWWEDDVLPSIKKVVANKAKEFRELGIEGIDLFISCFGPALKEFSKGYPVRSISGDLIRAEAAIEAARRVVIDITLQEIIKGKSYNIDPASKFYLTSWHFFRARKFPFDEARRLALSIGINIDDLKTNYKLLSKKSGDVELILPRDREKKGIINVDNPKDNGILINAVHIALLAYEQGGQKLFDNVVEKLRRNTDKKFRLYMEALFNVLPDVKDLSINLPEKKILGEILMITVEKITPKGGKITDFIE